MDYDMDKYTMKRKKKKREKSRSWYKSAFRCMCSVSSLITEHTGFELNPTVIIHDAKYKSGEHSPERVGKRQRAMSGSKMHNTCLIISPCNLYMNWPINFKHMSLCMKINSNFIFLTAWSASLDLIKMKDILD